VAAGAANVDRAFGGVDRGHASPHRTDGAGDLGHGLTADAHGHQQGADLRGRGFAGHDDGERGFGLVSGKRLPAGEFPECRFQVLRHGVRADQAARAGALEKRAMARKLARIRWPCSLAMLSGWNCTPWIGKSRWCMAMISLSSVHAVGIKVDGSVFWATI